MSGTKIYDLIYLGTTESKRGERNSILGGPTDRFGRLTARVIAFRGIGGQPWQTDDFQWLPLFFLERRYKIVNRETRLALPLVEPLPYVLITVPCGA